MFPWRRGRERAREGEGDGVGRAGQAGEGEARRGSCQAVRAAQITAQSIIATLNQQPRTVSVGGDRNQDSAWEGHSRQGDRRR